MPSLLQVFRISSLLKIPVKGVCDACIRNYAMYAKRFYKKAEILHCDNGLYEINLDHRKLKTPKGNVMKIDSEILALMVATEWNAQKDEIRLSTMHLTALCNTALENPNKIKKEEVVEKLISYLETDTILYHSQSEDVAVLQRKEWNPIILWFCKNYKVDIAATSGLTCPTIPSDTIDIIRQHLLCFNMAAIHGFIFCVESLKSIILTLACLERRLTVDNAVLLSRLEEEYQAGRWGRVEWAHDLNQLDLQSRAAAGLIFIQVNSLSEETKKIVICYFCICLHGVFQ